MALYLEDGDRKEVVSNGETLTFTFTVNQNLKYWISFQKLKVFWYFVGGIHRSATTKIYGDMTSKGSKVLIGQCSICNREQLMTVSDNKKLAEGLGDFSEKLL